MKEDTAKLALMLKREATDERDTPGRLYVARHVTLHMS